MQQYQIGEKVKYIKYKNKIAEIVFYIESTKYMEEEYAIKYLRGNHTVHAVVDSNQLMKLDSESLQISFFS